MVAECAQILTHKKDPQHQIFLLHSDKGPPNSLLRQTQWVKRRSRPWDCDLSVLTVFSCDWHQWGKVTPQLFCHAEASYGEATVYQVSHRH